MKFNLCSAHPADRAKIVEKLSYDHIPINFLIADSEENLCSGSGAKDTHLLLIIIKLIRQAERGQVLAARVGPSGDL